MRKIYVTATLLALFVGTAAAQDIYKVGLLTGTDLNGDARYVGMGGAMSALGANISAMGTNPASTAQYRRNDFAITGSLLRSSGKADDFDFFGANKTRTSLDQAGFVYSLPLESGRMRFVSLGFNYRKVKNFADMATLDNIGVPHLMSQTLQFTQLARTIKDNLPLDLSNNADRGYVPPLVNAAADVLLIDREFSKSGNDSTLVGYKPAYASAYNYGKTQWGSNQAYDFNLAFNFGEQFYFGVNLGLYNVDYHSRMQYMEDSRYSDGKPLYAVNSRGEKKNYKLNVMEDLTGTGVDAKFGFIVRPIAGDPLRLGLSITTPTFYSIETTSSYDIGSPYGGYRRDDGHYDDYIRQNSGVNNSYHIVAPWKVNFSVGTTIAKRFAVGAEYEITDHTSGQVRLPEGEVGYYDSGIGTHDKVMQKQINAYTRDTHTLRLGVEALLSRSVSVRAGYNFVSAPYTKDAYLNLFTDSPSYKYATSTDYVNYGATNRFTLGLGLRGENFYADAAYQYQRQGADVYAYHYNSADRFGVQNDLPGQHVVMSRNSFQLTIGYRF